MSTQVILFLVVFLTILGVYIALIAYAARQLNNRISQRQFELVERFLIGAIIVGVIGMFQPWVFVGYRIGFGIVFFATLGFILWSHVTPAAAEYE